MTKTAAIICFVLAACVLGYWAMDGQHMANQSEILKEVMVDDGFGGMTKEPKWVKEFHLGLMDGALPAALGLMGIGTGLFFVDIRSKKKAA